jgi:deazaflavin-dependent oxidoreductase (nitroreductase family)
MRILLVGTAALVSIVVLLWLLLLFGMRTKSDAILTKVRHLNRRVFNPRAMRTAGQPGAYASIVRHVGRNSGASYETPVVAVPTDEGFLVVLPYGTRPDWLRNLLSAGGGVLVSEGAEHAVESLEVVPLCNRLADLPPGELRSARLYRVEEALVLRSPGG